MELRIDGRPCDLGSGQILVPKYDLAATASIEALREGRSLRLMLPPTPENDAVLRGAADPFTGERFNDTLHRALLTADGATLFEGVVRLLAVSDEGYAVEIRDGGAQWAERAARQPLEALGVEYSAPLTPETICASWRDDTPVKFFPVHRDEYPRRASSLDLLPAERLLSVDDYHPFLHAATLLHQLFADAGYTLRSDFLSSELFRTLFVSGAYAAPARSAVSDHVGFSARRLSDVTAVADSMGRVYADPAAIYNTLGNIVESASPQSVDADGVALTELYNNGNCFSVEEGRICYRPLTEVSVGFEYTLRYTTDHRILTRERLAGFDTFYLGAGSRMHFTLANRYTDRRGELAANHRYTALVFDHAEGASYRLLLLRDGVATPWADFAARTAAVTTPPRRRSRRGAAPGRHARGVGPLHGGLGPLRRLHRRAGADDGRGAPAECRRADLPLRGEVLRPALHRGGRGGDVAHPPQGDGAAPPLPRGARVRGDARVR